MTDYQKALELVNAELAKYGRPPLIIGELQQRASYQSLQEYMHVTQRPIEIAVADIVRFQIQGETLEGLKA